MSDAAVSRRVIAPRGLPQPAGAVGEPSSPAMPVGPCFACHRTDWWTGTSGQPICRRCHPPVSEVAS